MASKSSFYSNEQPAGGILGKAFFVLYWMCIFEGGVPSGVRARASWIFTFIGGVFEEGFIRDRG